MKKTVDFATFWSYMPEKIRIAFSNIDSFYWQEESMISYLWNALESGKISLHEYRYALGCIASMTLIADTYLCLKENHSWLWLLSESAERTANNIFSLIPSISDPFSVANFLIDETKIWFKTLYAFLSDEKLWPAIVQSNQLFIKFADFETQLRIMLDKIK